MVRWGCVVVALVLAAGCGGSTSSPGPSADSTASASSDAPSGTTSAAPSSPTGPAGGTSETSAPRRPARWLGIDASHHQGAIRWRRVRADGIRFAWLKASEGTGFTDPRFVAHVRGARQAGVRVGGYHYFSTCSPGAPQAAHFLRVLRSAGRTTMPPAIDLELQGNCSRPPPRPRLLAEVRVFVNRVERSLGEEIVVYLFPDFERRYRFAAALDRRQWVRRLGERPPARDWWVWQRSQSATVDGVAGPVDLNVLRHPPG